MSMNKKLIPPLACTAAATVLLLVAATDGAGRNRIDIRNWGLHERLRSCDSFKHFSGDVQVGYTWPGNLVFDVRTLDRSETRLIDVLHLFLQFGSKIADTGASRITIAAGGREVFWIQKRDLDELSEQYRLGARLWAFNHWPERLRRPNGERAYGGWSGGALGVMSGQLEDMADALREWVASVSI